MLVELTDKERGLLLMLMTGLVEEVWVKIRRKLEGEGK